MSFLPIVERELRVASRRRATYWTRTLLGLMACALWLMLLATGGRRLPASETGKVLFIMVSVLALAFSMIVGVFLTADCLSEEKREGTLGLLFLTELRGYDVVLGKLMATSLPAFYALLTILPVLALPLLMGGVSFGEFGRVCLLLIVTLTQSLCIGLGVSAFSRDARQAMSFTLLIIVTLSGIMPLLAWVLEWWTGSSAWHVLFWTSPGYLFSRSFDVYYRWRGSWEYWRSFATVGGFAMIGLVAANLRLPRSWQEGGEGRVQRGVGDWLRRWRFGDPSFRAARRNLLDANPFYWLATRDRMPQWLACAVTGALLLFWIGLIVGCFSRVSSTRDVCFGINMAVAFGLHVMLKWSIAAEASRRFSEDRRSGALELLLVTPLSVGQIIEGQRRALRHIYLMPLALALVTNFGFLWMMFGPNPLKMHSWDHTIFSELYAGGVLLLLADFNALVRVGMWMGLRAKGHNRAVLATLGRILLVPWLAAVFVWFVGVTGGFGGGPETALVIFMMWQTFSILLDLVFTANARDSLRQLFRSTCAGTFSRAEASQAI